MLNCLWITPLLSQILTTWVPVTQKPTTCQFKNLGMVYSSQCVVKGLLTRKISLKLLYSFSSSCFVVELFHFFWDVDKSTHNELTLKVQQVCDFQLKRLQKTFILLAFQHTITEGFKRLSISDTDI